MCLWMDQDDGRRRNIGVNRLVLLTFVGPPPTLKHEAAHWDGDGNNNALGNLRWATHAENEMDKVRHGTSNRGVRHRLAKLSESAVLTIRARVSAGEKQCDLAREFGMSIHAVSAAVLRKSWAWLDGPAA